MTYVVYCLASLQPQCLIELISQSVEIRRLAQSDGFSAITIRCDVATAAVIAERWHVSEIKS